MNKLFLLLLSVVLLGGCQDDSNDPVNPNEPGGGSTDVAADKANPLGADVYYEIFVRSFADSDGDGIGDLNGVTSKLDYLEGLGVKGIWLMPINPSPSYHGYDVTDYKAVNPDYGTIEDFDRLVSEAKSRGIAVVLDFVINHSSQEHPWFKESMASMDAESRDYYTWVHKDEVKAKCEAGEVDMVDDNYYNANFWRSPWGVDTEEMQYRYIGQFSGSMPDFNYGRVPDLNPIYDEILSAAEFWMEHGAAGLRLDAIKHIYQKETGGENLKFLKRFYDDLVAKYPNIYMVGEALCGMDDTAPFFYSLPSLFHFDAWWKLHGSLLDWGAKYYAKDMETAYNKFKVQNSTFNACLKLSNHDEDRAMSTLGGNNDLAKIAAMAILTTPGQPYIYYGEEVGMSNTKAFGDEGVREPILWGDNSTATWRENTAPTATVEEQLLDENSLLNFYRSAIKMRNETPALQRGTFNVLPYSSMPAHFMGWYRALGDKQVFVLMNGGNSIVKHTIDHNISSAKELFRKGSYTLTQAGEKTEVSLEPYSIIIVEKTL